MAIIRMFLPTRFYLQVRNNGIWSNAYALKTDNEIVRAMNLHQRALHDWRIVDTTGQIVFPEF